MSQPWQSWFCALAWLCLGVEGIANPREPTAEPIGAKIGSRGDRWRSSRVAWYSERTLKAFTWR